MKWLFMGVALFAGAGLACQAGFNSHLRAKLGHPIPAALTNFTVGLICLLTLGLVTPTVWPSARDLTSAPWWAWLGGLVGAVYVATTAAFARKLGAAAWLAAVVTGQILASLTLDHFGLIGFRPHPLNGPRLLGAALLLVGVVLVLRH